MIDPQFIGYCLLRTGFETWFKYCFKAINNRPFIVEKTHSELFDTIQTIIDGESTRQVISLCPRSGKCFGKGTLVRMYDGTIKKIEEIQVGEKVMGRDSTPRTVIGLGRGQEPMYRITNADGSSFVCNESHLLVLHNTVNSRRIRLGRGKKSFAGIENIISVKNYLQTTPSYKRRNKAIKAPVDYPHRNNILDPYMLGVWLGDGSKGSGNITNPDPEIISYIYAWADKNKNKVRVQHQKRTLCDTYCLSGNGGAPLITSLRQLGVLYDKHIPESYLITDREDRKKLLAGIIDTDGTNAGGKGSVSITQKSERFIDQIIDLARGLGFYASKQVKFNKTYNRNYYMVYISGAIDDLPLKIKRKNTGHSLRKPDVLLQSFSVEPLGLGNYYGICVDKDEEFLLADYTVVHNTTMSTWLVVYCLLMNPKSNIIYTSYSQELLKQISNEVASIMQHPIFLAMFGDLSLYAQEEETNPIDDFWREYLQNEEKKATYTNRKITTAQGGTVLFSAIGSQITGFGVAIRGQKGFTGMLIIDDADKVSDIRSEKIREKTHIYFSETLLTRLNNPEAPILCVQQRLHIDDLSGFLIENYGFKVFKAPLLDENGVCNFPSQYTEERIKELQINNYAFQAQYQQEPIMLGGGVFHVDWFGYYDNMENTPYRRIFITADTASKTKEWNDYTAIGVWGVTQNNRLRLLDLVHAKMEMPELHATFLALWEKWQGGIKSCRCSAIYIEDKASGTQVIQLLQRKGGLPIMPVTPKADKLTRALDAVPFVAAHNIELPGDDKHPITKVFLDEVAAFSPDGNTLHDDIVDCFLYAVDAAYNQRGYF